MNNQTQLTDLGIALDKIQQLKQQLESCQNELSGISGQLKEAVEVIEKVANYMGTTDLGNVISRQFLAKYRGEK